MKILIAEDDNITRRRLEKFLADMDFEVVSCGNGLDAWKIIQSEDPPNLLILDWMIPGMDGLEICRKVRKLARDPYTFIMLLTSKGRQDDYIKGMEAGADDYITKPFNHNELRARLKVGKRIVELNKELLSVRDNFEKQATIDHLTGLYNRHYMVDILEKEFARALRYQTDLSCLLLDLDCFKDVNDTFGHVFGDFVLREFSTGLKQNARITDIPIRYGGEEFMILLPNTGVAEAQKVAEKILATCKKKKYEDGLNSTRITVSIGIASLKQHQLLEGKEIIACADKALYQSKAEGRNRITVYTKPPWISEDNRISEDKNLRYLKENLSVILEKAKKSSIRSLELLTRDIGGEDHKQHNHDVKRYITLIGERLALPPAIIETFRRAANFHDNFKVLLKKTIKAKTKVLNKEERIEIEDHPYMLSELIDLFDFFANEKSILQYHHENFNGTGYPDGLKENEIPLGARIFAMTDAITAMLSGRLYKAKLSPEEMVVELANKAGTQFDPALVSLFFDIIEKQELFSVPAEVLEQARGKVGEKK
ncbi:MAG: diguanylate cyclase [Candidatus Scalindua rubra]|uniref:diguanylate cyclase n=1 Tax=Candidatus Scalindua brodae TaxID=237368 RepID=A0A0B0ENP2_9BACT|nr:MAG: two-component response regulator [Candidatus Scalindua brodae]MBZ0109302.1 diguanylate cyclase [Candidatus Scalindua rubra]TWU36782.1 Response regulator PleD [Candidatus Brocadiaceae bacterium S225]